MRTRATLKLATAAGLFVFGLLFAASASAAEADYVIHISVDGLASYLLETRIDSAGYENFKRFVDEGATTFDARIDDTQSWTMANHVGMVTARPAELPAGQPNTVYHGYLDNGEPDPGWTLHDSQFNPNVSYIASAWDVAHDNGLVTALYASKPKFVLFDQSYDSGSGALDTTGPDNGTDKIDYYSNQSTAYWNPAILDAKLLHDDFIADMGANRFNYTFLHYTDPDKSGHEYGWGTTQWYDTVENVDDYLGEIFELIETDPLLDGHTVVILTSDHGGTGFGHSDETNPLNYRIPVFVWGVGVDAGVDLYVMNPNSRRDPDAAIAPGGAPVARPDYNAVPQPIRNGGSGNLALYHLGLPPIPPPGPAGATLNDSQDLHSQATQSRFTAYNDCVYDAALSDTDPNGTPVHYKAGNTTTYGIGTICSDCGSTGAGTAYSFSSGRLLDISDGRPTSVSVSITENTGVATGVDWQSQVGPSGSPVAGSWNGGHDTASGTDARDTFGGVADMTGAVCYGDAGWWVDLEFTGLDPAKFYTFATSASRGNSTGDYPSRVTLYTLSGVDASSNASTTGVTEISPTSVSFVTGDNHAEGYVARWADIDSGADGTFSVRAEADPSSPESRMAYSFDVFMLEEQAARLCGDDTVDPGEDCDDGNTDSGDCCSSTCQYEPVSTVCRASTQICDVTEVCDGVGNCPADAWEPDITECRAAAGICDVAEYSCSLSGGACPADGFEPITTECRGAAGVCDAVDYCDGVSITCGSDGKLTSECRASTDVCDAAESCDGVADDCPADAFEPATTLCRAPAGVCDAPDYCDAASAACPADAKLTTECRASTHSCDAAEICDGVSDDCLRDLPANGEWCPDGDLCNGDELCVGWTCTAGEPCDCDDGDICTADSCDPILGCVHDPIAPIGSDCRQPDLPSASPAGRLLLSLLVAGAGAMFLARRRRSGA